MLNTKQIDRTEAHVEKKNHLKINRPGDRNYSAEADSGLSKQLLGNFQTEHSCHRNYSRLIKKSEAVVQRCSVKKVFLKISQNSQEKTCAGVSFLMGLHWSCLKKIVYYNDLARGAKCCWAVYDTAASI